MFSRAGRGQRLPTGTGIAALPMGTLAGAGSCDDETDSCRSWPLLSVFDRCSLASRQPTWPSLCTLFHQGDLHEGDPASHDAELGGKILVPPSAEGRVPLLDLLSPTKTVLPAGGTAFYDQANLIC